MKKVLIIISLIVSFIIVVLGIFSGYLFYNEGFNQGFKEYDDFVARNNRATMTPIIGVITTNGKYPCDEEFKKIEGWWYGYIQYDYVGNFYKSSEVEGNCERIKEILDFKEEVRIKKQEVKQETEYCESLGYLKQSDLPVKCLKYWE